jgi:hypothetical protein
MTVIVAGPKATDRDGHDPEVRRRCAPFVVWPLFRCILFFPSFQLRLRYWIARRKTDTRRHGCPEPRIRCSKLRQLLLTFDMIHRTQRSCCRRTNARNRRDSFESSADPLPSTAPSPPIRIRRRESITGQYYATGLREVFSFISAINQSAATGTMVVSR